MAVAGYRRGSPLAEALGFPSFGFSQAAQAVERSAGVMRKFLVGIANTISTGARLDSSRKVVMELMAVLEFSGMTAVGVQSAF